MNIVAIREIFKLQSSFYLPNHPDYKMMHWSQIHDGLDIDAYIQLIFKEPERHLT